MAGQKLDSVALLSTTEAAKRIGIGASTLHRWIDKGKVNATNINGHRYLSHRSLEEAKATKAALQRTGEYQRRCKAVQHAQAKRW